MPDSKHSTFDTTTPRENNGSHSSGTASQKTAANKKYFEEGTYAVLHEWWAENIENPYPDREERDRLCKGTGLTHKQLVDWFANRRKRSRVKSGEENTGPQWREPGGGRWNSAANTPTSGATAFPTGAYNALVSELEKSAAAGEDCNTGTASGATKTHMTSIAPIPKTGAIPPPMPVSQPARVSAKSLQMSSVGMAFDREPVPEAVA